MWGFMSRRSPLDDPQTAAHAWARYRRLMRFMFAFTVLTVIVALTVVYTQVEDVSPHFFIATALGIGFSMLLMSALMGLVFLSSGTGHDESVENSLEGLDPQAQPPAKRYKLGWRDESEG